MASLDHRYSKRRLGAFVDDELQASDLDRVIGHLIECPDCSAEVRFLLRVRAALEACEEMSTARERSRDQPWRDQVM